jgi:hypothetical protein
MLGKLRSAVEGGRNSFLRPICSELGLQRRMMQSLHDIALRAELDRLIADSKNPLNHCGAKYFSQSDEDGITLEILRRIGLRSGVFVELGVGNGLENNTLILLASGWSGVWIGGEELAFDERINSQRLSFRRIFVTNDNIVPTIRDGLTGLSSPSVDLLSLDLDGNDLYFIDKILSSGILPAVIIIEYNGKFPPPIRWSISYDPGHVWDSSDYHGASLQSMTDVLTKYAYKLVCCNVGTGANAFFVAEHFHSAFEDVPIDISDIFVPLRANLFVQWGHRPSPDTVACMLKAP